jgi:ketosteroid isomerase-like protein
VAYVVLLTTRHGAASIVCGMTTNATATDGMITTYPHVPTGRSHQWGREGVDEREDFHQSFLPRFIDSLRAFHDGDPEPHIALWSTADPVTLFAIRGMRNVGSDTLRATFRRVAAWFSDVAEYEWELLASGVSDDSAYTVCIERFTASVNGSTERFEVRSTHLFRLEEGRWLAMHRHADRQPPEQPVRGRTTRGLESRNT